MFRCENQFLRFSSIHIVIRFSFDTIDEYYNGYEGWYVDGVRVLGSLDSNGDGVPDDNCPFVANLDQSDVDADSSRSPCPCPNVPDSRLGDGPNDLLIALGGATAAAPRSPIRSARCG
jgi:hypothetical protein